MKKLNENEAKHYFELLGDLMAEASERFVFVADDEEDLSNAMRMDNAYYARLSNFIWTTDSIDRYIEEDAESLTQEDIEILHSWKEKHITGEFLIIEHVNDGSLFLDASTEKLYLVKGIQSTIEEMTMGLPLPLYIQTTLLPYKDKIITDGTGGVGQLGQSDELIAYLKKTVKAKQIIRKL